MTPEPEALARVPEEDVVVVNQTNKRLELTGSREDSFVISPLSRRTLSASEVVAYPLEQAVKQNYVRVEPVRSSRDARLRAFLGLGVWAVIAFVVYGLVAGTTSYWAVGFPVIALAAAGLWCFRSDAHRRAFVRWIARMPSRLAELGVLLLALGAAVVVPALAVFFAADIDGALLDYGLPVEEGGDDASRHLVASALQFLLVMTFAGVPALLYFAFDREQLQTLRSKFVFHVFRFDPSVETVADIDARYGRVMDEAYGRETLTGRILPGKRLPVVIATGAIAMGWLLTLPLTSYATAWQKSLSLHDYLRPHERPIVFAFLGAYFFALNLVFRGYVRGDLRPKTYSQITVRILLSFVLAFVLGQAFDSSNPVVLLIAFLGGVVPETVLVRLRETVRHAGGRGSSRGEPDALDALVEQQPLTEVEGIDIYDRARLEEEGVTNVEALAHHDLVELMLRTRIPVSRLVDWVDQAILYLHLGGRTREGKQAQLVLRQHGIRTATDLVTAWRDSDRSGTEGASAGNAHPHPLADLLGPTPEGMPSRVELIVDAIADEEWIDTLLHWHQRRGLETESARFVPGQGLVEVDAATRRPCSELVALAG
jgi:hypothetical protein